ncbi:MAG: hypothetical protein V1689_06365 [Pseudomonadota bacterium]
MLHKKKSKKKSPFPNLQSSDEDLIASFMQDFGNTEPGQIVARVPNALIAHALVERLPLDESSVPFLTAIDEKFQDKGVRKAVKRVLFKLKNKGLPVDDFQSKGGVSAPILKPPQEEEPVALLGPLDMKGSRAVLVTLGRTMRGIDGGMGIVSDEEGIKQFACGAFSKKVLKGIKEQLSQEAGFLVETTLAHATSVLEEAYRRHLELHSEAPEEYLELRPRLLNVGPPLDTPAIYGFITEDSVSQRPLTDSQIEKLFQNELMEPWVVDFEDLRPFMEDISKMDDSPIILTQTQKADRAREIEEKCMEQLFPASKRAILRRRLEEMAYIFFKLGQEDFSRLSLAAGLSMGGEDSILRKNPVVEHLVRRSLDFYNEIMEMKASEEASKAMLDIHSTGIITP